MVASWVSEPLHSKAKRYIEGLDIEEYRKKKKDIFEVQTEMLRTPGYLGVGLGK